MDLSVKPIFSVVPKSNPNPSQMIRIFKEIIYERKSLRHWCVNASVTSVGHSYTALTADLNTALPMNLFDTAV